MKTATSEKWLDILLQKMQFSFKVDFYLHSAHVKVQLCTQQRIYMPSPTVVRQHFPALSTV